MPRAKKPNKNMERLEELFREMDAEDSIVVEAPKKKKPRDYNKTFREPKTRTHPHRLECGHWNWWLSGTKKDKNRICTDPRCKRLREQEEEQDERTND